MSAVCTSLRHKTLAFAMQRAKEARLAKEAQDKLEASIKSLDDSESTAREKASSLEKQYKELQQKMKNEQKNTE
jgi:hypothetical protein